MLEKEFTILLPDEVDKHREKVSAIYVAVKPRITEEVIASFPNLRVIGNCAVGYDNVNVKACFARGIRVGYTPNVLNDCTADMAWALMLAAGRRVVEGDKLSRNPDTTAFDWNWFGFRITGMTLGIIGMGRIGYEVAKRAHGFNMQVLYHNRTRRSKEDEDLVKATYIPSLPNLLGQSDYVVLVAPATKETYRMMGREQFKAMKKTAFFVNVSRGTLVDQDALFEALRDGVITGAGLDVTDPEPLPRDHPLLTLPNITITPHIASATMYTRRAMVQMTIDNILTALNGKPMVNEVKP